MVNAARDAARPTPDAEPVLTARFAVPRLPEGFVRRPRLLTRATEGLAHPLLLVNGPAGAGKSLLVADWSASDETHRVGRVVWLTAERGDDEANVFWARVLQALHHCGVDLPGETTAPALAPASASASTPAPSPTRAEPPAGPVPLRIAAQLATRSEPVILIIDQFERVDNAEVAAGLDFLLTHAAAGLRLVLISRTEPLLPLHRYRASGEITEIRGADLAFLPEETAVLLRGLDVCLHDDAVRALTERTEGWIAGLRLSAIAAKHADEPEVYLKEFEAGESTLADFLLAEVLATQSPEAQDLILRTSIVERTHAELADVLTGRHDGARILEELAHHNAFIEPLGHRWYRHHPLFAEILRYRLRAGEPGVEVALHRRAAHWLDEAGRLMEALPHAAEAGDWNYAASRLVSGLAIGRLLVGLDAEMLRSLFTRMPAQTSGRCPELVRAALALVHHDARRMLIHLDRADAEASEPELAPTVELTSAFLRAQAAALTGSADDAQDCAAAADVLGEQTPDGRLAAHPELPGLLDTALGSACLWEGRFDAASIAFTRALELPLKPESAAMRQDALSRLALIDLLCGSVGRAQEKARAALTEAPAYGFRSNSGSGVAHLVLAWADFERDELDAARAGLDSAACAIDEPDPTLSAAITILRSKFLLADGDPAAALDLLRGLRSAPWESPVVRTSSPWQAPETADIASAAQLALGDPEAALATAARGARGNPACAVALARAQLSVGSGQAALDTLAAAGRPDTRPPVAARELLVSARAAQCVGDDKAAMSRLAQALATARPDRLRRPFRESAAWVRCALREHRALANAHPWLPHDLRAAEPAGGPASSDPGKAVIVEALSVREHEVLECAAQMMSTAEIADELFLSANTVKTHLKNINRKLCTTRRADAVRRARQLRIL